MPRLVAVTADRRALGPQPEAPPGRVRPPRPEVVLKEAVVTALRAAGLEPVLLPPHDGDPGALVAAVLETFAGVVVTGGAFDIHPGHYGEAVSGRLDRVDAGRTGLELALCRGALARGTPVLGLCGGLQALAVAAGGSLVQHLPDALGHEQTADPATASHAVVLSPGRLRDAFGRAQLAVNSTHHQAVAAPGALVVTGRAPDGVVEAAEHPTHPFAVGVQWHPELLPDHGPVFTALARALGPA